jgi:phenylpropionate dioxygenase-like ring-hydroxylating dioxygenase large terminal subunit
VPAVVAEQGLDIGALRHHRRVSSELRANWKVAIENYLECYHCAINPWGSSTRSTSARCASRARPRG